MLVIAVGSASATARQVSWTGRRHDDDGTESTGTQTAQGLFESVFHALHDGEQVAVGFECPLTVAADQLDARDTAGLLARARAIDGGAGVARLRELVTELGRWRPWTIVTTSLPRWRATTSVLMWEALADDAAPAGGAAAIEAFYAMLRTGDQPGDPGAGSLLNLAAAAAVDSDATADPAELTRPALQIRWDRLPAMQ